MLEKVKTHKKTLEMDPAREPSSIQVTEKQGPKNTAKQKGACPDRISEIFSETCSETFSDTFLKHVLRHFLRHC
jgi:hypothetical protein